MDVFFKHLQSPGREGDNGKRIIINEPGLYSLILRSRVPQAKEFKRWVTHYILSQNERPGTGGEESVVVI